MIRITKSLGLFLLSLTCLSSTTLFAVDFYVATNGNDSNPGTLASPFLTLTKAQAAENAAGTGSSRRIYIRGGNYYNVTMRLQGPQAGVGHDDSGTSCIGYRGE